MSVTIQLRRDLAANWTTDNPVLAQGEVGYETDSRKMKLGDGSTAWVSLPYFTAGDADSTYINVRGSWATSTNYAVNDFVSVASGTYSGGLYLCLTAHTSGGSFSGPGANWEQIQAPNGTYAPLGPFSVLQQNTPLTPRFLSEQYYEALRTFVEWCVTNGVTPYVGEVGWPGTGNAGTSGQTNGWNALNDGFYTILDDILTTGPIPATYWEAGKQFKTNMNNVYYSSVINEGGGVGGTMDSAWSESTVIEAHLGASNRGVNVTDQYWGAPGTRVAGASTTYYFGNTGTLGTTYAYPTLGDFQFLVARGHKLFRMPVSIERLMASPTATSLVSGELAALTASINACGTAGGQVIIDCHNYGLVGSSSDNLVHQIANSDNYFTQSDLVEFWTLMSTAFMGNANVKGYGIMNEPWGSTSRGLYVSYVQACITGIRGNGDTKVISVPTIDYTLPGSPAAPYTDTASNLWYEAHFYADQSGNFNVSLAQQEKTAKAQAAILSGGIEVPFSFLGSMKEESVPRELVTGSTTLVNGQLSIAYFTAVASQSRTQLSTAVRSTGSSGASYTATGLYQVNSDDSLTLLTYVPGGGTTWQNTFTTYNQNLNASVLLIAGQRYAIAPLQIGGTMPALYSAPNAGPPNSQTNLPRFAAQAATGYTTTVGSGSNGGTLSGIASWGTPGNGILSTGTLAAGTPSSGQASVVTTGGLGIIAYTGTSGGNTLTGCTYVSGTGTTVATGAAVIFLLSALPSSVAASALLAPVNGRIYSLIQ